MGATNRMTNNLGRFTSDALTDSIAPFNFDNLPYFFKHAKKGIRHTIPVSFSFKVLKYFTMSPSVSYENKMYFEKYDWKRDAAGKMVAKPVSGFNSISNYSFSTPLTTRLYGTYFFKRGRVKAIRHIVNPSVSFNYTPDFSKNANYFDTFKIKNTTKDMIIYKSKHEGFVYGGSNLGRSSAVGFSLGNNLEMKVKSEKDTVARKISLLNNLSIASSYNLLADSFNLATFSMAANTNVLNNLLNININATLDPYSYTDEVNSETKKTVEKRINSYALTRYGGLGRITNATLAMSTNLNPKGRAKEQSTRDKVGKSDIPEAEKQYIIANPNAYIDFDIPWSLNVSYNLNYGHSVNVKSTVTQTITFSGDLSISEKWKINFNSGYHFESKEFTQTNVTIARDLHCWTMNLTWVPFGRFQSYNFVIAVKASILQDLKLERRKPFQDNL